MEINGFGIELLRRFLWFLPSFFILASCIYYLTRKVGTEGILLIIGSAVNLFASLFQYIIMPYLIKLDTIDTRVMGYMYSVLGVINYIAQIVFAIGLFILIHNLIKKKNNRADSGLLDEVQA